MKVPWYAKMGVKLILARVPISHRAWYRMGIFKHGKMQEFEYAHSVFAGHLKIAGLEDVHGNAGKILLELGPGESLYSAVLAKAYGFAGSILSDVGNFALPPLTEYLNLAEWLRQRGLSLPDLRNCSDLPGLLSLLDADYRTDGLASLKGIPAGSVDFIFSQAVREHVRRAEFGDTAREMRRILAPGGVSTHVIDLKDHLEASLNNLRFGESFWESRTVSSSGFYTNRLRADEIIEIYMKAGFAVEVIRKVEWRALPLPRKALAPQFRDLPDDLLRISGFTIRLH